MLISSSQGQNNRAARISPELRREKAMATVDARPIIASGPAAGSSDDRRARGPRPWVPGPVAPMEAEAIRTDRGVRPSRGTGLGAGDVA